MKKVLLVGSGLRVQSGIVPALWCLRDEFEITAVYSRSIKDLSFCDGQLKVTTVNSLLKVDFKSLDLIMVAVTLSEVPNVLRALSQFETRHIALMLDTPVLDFKNLFAAKLFRRFKKVLASEDTIALPPFVSARTLIDSGKIGKLKNIYFFHNGYKYHALASLKTLTNSRIKFLRSRKFSGKLMQKDISFKNDVRAVLYEPREYTRGKFLIEGDKGIVADYDFKNSVKRVYQIGYKIENGIYRGLTLDGQELELNDLDKKYLSNISENIFDKSNEHHENSRPYGFDNFCGFRKSKICL